MVKKGNMKTPKKFAIVVEEVKMEAYVCVCV